MGSHDSNQANNHSVKITLDKDVIDGKNGKIFLGNGEGKSASVGNVELTIAGGSNDTLKKLEQNGNDNISLNLNNVKSPLGGLPLDKLTNLTLNNSAVKVAGVNITDTLTLTAGSEVRVENPTPSNPFADEDTPVTTISPKINKINTTDNDSKINISTDNINLTISNITGNLPKLEGASLNSGNTTTINLPKGYEITQNEQGRPIVRNTTQQSPSGSNTQPEEVKPTSPVVPTTPTTPKEESHKPTTPEKPSTPAEGSKPSAPVMPETPKQTTTVQKQILEAFEKLAFNGVKDKQALAEKIQQSLQTAVQSYNNYDFSLSIDAIRVAETRLNDLAFFNGTESASTNNNYLMSNTYNLKNPHSL